MATNKMLIDATHPEETRVVVLRNGRVEEFDYESAARKLLRGNIYLAKVTRVEPSLQAAFVDYGGNRHGFLAFNEIHPDYYQIPMADRQALLEEEALAEAEEEAEADARAERLARRRRQQGASAGDEAGHEDGDPDQAGHHHEDDDDDDHDDDEADEASEDNGYSDAPVELAGAGHDDAHEEDAPRVIAEASARDEVRTEEPSAPESHTAELGEARDAPSASGDAHVSDAVAEEEAATAIADVVSEPSGEGDEPGIVQVVASGAAEPEALENAGSEDALEELPVRPRRRPRSYKIQEVIKRRQVILVQVVKEERGNKGAALTTYLSLAGRYTVLMPNTARGGGISRKITNPQDRKRLKAIAQELDVPEGMGLIIRTAGAARTKQEIKRDFEYLLRLWESVRDLTLESTAPSLVYEEGNLIKRSIRDLYNKDIEEIVVAGDHAHKDAKDFMRMLMPSHAKNVLLHQDPEPLFTKYGIERQLNAMFSPYVTLKSGGYLVINQTEALVAIDVNSGKATREFSIEETALNTNLEAADEIARQLKLRDLAGLIVIDFIDMEEKRNTRNVERRLKDALRFDRARIQLGRISHFGLMEMSRQRLRSGVLEGSTSQCPHCQGTGIIRSTESVALAVLRALEDALMQGANTSLIATTTSSVALYILNNKRHFINDMEVRNGVFVTVQASDKLQGANFLIEKGHAPATVPARRPDRAAVNMDWGFTSETAEEASEADVEEVGAEVSREREESREGGGRRRRRRRGRRGGEGRARGEGIAAEEGAQLADDAADDHHEMAPESAGVADDGDGDGFGEEDVSYEGDGGANGEARASEAEHGRDDHEDGNGRRRRRGRRGGRRGRDRTRRLENGGEEAGEETAAEAAEALPGELEPKPANDGDAPSLETANEVSEAPPAPKRASRRREETPAAPAAANGEPADQSEPKVAVKPAASVDKPASAPARKQQPEAAVVQSAPAVPEASSAPVAPAASQEPALLEGNSVAARALARQAAAPAEPKLERVVVSPDSAAATAAEGGSEEPVKRGWWQRRLRG
ncbi:Rne/Rng family ribonuclease [Hyphomicrobium sp.]|uniref:Rne/Rng family ribonuclease n=1 Tax=Hyphomicrobium sp. TaxID=82 RepID=UPI002FDD0411